MAKECFTLNDKALASRPTTVAAKHMGYDYAVFGFAPYSPFWREMRKIVMFELLSNRRLDTLKHVQVSEVDIGIQELYKLWVNNNSDRPMLVELKRWFEDLTLNVIARMVDGKRYFGVGATCNNDEARRCQKAINQFFYLIGIFVPSDAFPILGWFEHRDKPRCTSVEAKSTTDTAANDFIDVMLLLQEGLSSFPYDADTSIKSTCLALILGGSDTTAGTLTWAISLLLNKPKILTKAQEEIDLHAGIWEDPDVLKPDRFLMSNVDVKGIDFELIPFGSGG
ncbi:Cytochrome 82C4 [Capsicum annuum]|nr:Cytochrome 82C4 [Capsicum annuum]